MAINRIAILGGIWENVFILLKIQKKKDEMSL
jgi:hypothetical protein